MTQAKPFVLAITGASGAIYGLRLLQFLLSIEQPVDLALSRAARRVMLEEHDLVSAFGDPYRDYQARVPMLIPWRFGKT